MKINARDPKYGSADDIRERPLCGLPLILADILEDIRTLADRLEGKPVRPKHDKQGWPLDKEW